MKDPLTGAEIGTLKADGKVHEPDEFPLEEWYDRSDDVLLAGPETDHGDFPFRLFIRWRDLSDALTAREIEEHGGLCEEVEILCVSIDAAGPDRTLSAYQSCGPDLTMNEFRGLYGSGALRRACYEAMVNYGCQAILWYKAGKAESKDELIAEAKSQIRAVNMLLGFYMDQPQNRIGCTGWDMVKGNLLPEDS